ncbi:general transcription factor IIE subunit 1-like [Halichondria panicea]|uniref:general transcription factor IIE subunit 1-like n=1 Tax=Halichondria panicea TaxID=6063 RepID=UPI00312B7795
MDLPQQTRTIPQELKRLVRVIARSFYQPMQIVCLDILATYPCVAEGDLVELLRMQGSQRLLRQALTFLQKDKIIKSQQRMEGDSGGLVRYYYINYKHFVNVVKYKLDKIHRNIEAEERRVHNQTSYKCPTCGSTYTDLDVDRLFNPANGSLCCSYCSGVLEEENVSVGDKVDSRTLISMLNDQIRPITELLKFVEKVNLAPDVLEPEPSSIKQAGGYSRPSGAAGKDTDNWSRNRPIVNIYGENADISIHMGDGDTSSTKTPTKSVPEWMSRSTVQDEPSLVPTEDIASTSTITQRDKKDDQILADLLTHEVRSDESKGRADEKPEYSGSESDEEMEDVESSDEEEEQFIVKVGDRTVPLDQVTDSLVAQMTEEEKEQYKHVYQQASMHVEDL